MVLGGFIVLDNADKGYDLSPLRGFARYATDNVICRTDINVRTA